MFCPKCGKEINNNSLCECNTYIDKGGFKYGLLGFLFPVAGIVIYYMLKDKEPNLCNSFKIGSMVGIILWILILATYYTIYFMIFYGSFFEEFLYY